MCRVVPTNHRHVPESQRTPSNRPTTGPPTIDHVRVALTYHTTRDEQRSKFGRRPSRERLVERPDVGLGGGDGGGFFGGSHPHRRRRRRGRSRHGRRRCRHTRPCRCLRRPRGRTARARPNQEQPGDANGQPHHNRTSRHVTLRASGNHPWTVADPCPEIQASFPERATGIHRATGVSTGTHVGDRTVGQIDITPRGRQSAPQQSCRPVGTRAARCVGRVRHAGWEVAHATRSGAGRHVESEQRSP